MGSISNYRMGKMWCLLLLFGATIILVMHIKNISDKTQVSVHLPQINKMAFYESNIKQIHAGSSIWFGIRKNSVFFYSSRSSFKYKNCLCVIENGKIERLKKFHEYNHIWIIGLQGDYLYYWKLSDSKKDELLQYNILKHSEQKIYQGEASRRNLVFADEGNMFIPINDDKSVEYILVREGTEIEFVETDPFYSIGEYNYYTKAGNPSYGESALAEHIYSSYKSEIPDEIKLEPANNRILLKCGNGIIVQNDGYEDILYYINEENELVKIMSVECMCSNSSIAVINNTAYISVKRFEGWGSSGKGMKRFIDDQIEGTYKVDISCFAVEKISNMVYDTMYVFDETHIIGCDEHLKVWLLDLDSENTTLLF